MLGTLSTAARWMSMVDRSMVYLRAVKKQACVRFARTQDIGRAGDIYNYFVYRQSSI